MILGRKYRGATVDVWSLGIILFAMICGYLPFEEENTSKLYKKILSGEYQTPYFISEDARHLLSHILSVNPDRRYTLKDIKSHPWLSSTSNCSLLNLSSCKLCIPKINPKVVSQVASYGFANSEQVIKDLKRNCHNKGTVVYYLLQTKVLDRVRDIERKFKTGGKESGGYESAEDEESCTELGRSFSFTKSSFYARKVEAVMHKKSGSVSYFASTQQSSKKTSSKEPFAELPSKVLYEGAKEKEVINSNGIPRFLSSRANDIKATNKEGTVKKQNFASPQKNADKPLKPQHNYANTITNQLLNCKRFYDFRFEFDKER
eukprot:TRINITY_DN2110_c0_g8_i1.p1 TRINITY_DN2110_c0_g8~~TRINITY_DN2110_c0_g8_i1.p1  ORF type:complete len:318 (+),score=75.45 TRINITY_DN2110_c0_g8_i1:702-1655(+)